MAGTLTATGRTGRETAGRVCAGTLKITETPLSFRARLAEIAVRRLMAPETRETRLMTEVVCQAVRDVGIGGPWDSYKQWHRQQLNPYFEAFGVEPECVEGILRGVRLWHRRDVYRKKG